MIKRIRVSLELSRLIFKDKILSKAELFFCLKKSLRHSIFSSVFFILIAIVSFAKTQQQTTLSDNTSLDKYKEYDRYMISLERNCKELSFSKDLSLTQNVVHTYIINALEMYDKGQKTDYEDLRKQFSTDPKSPGAPSPAELKRLLFSLIHVASKLNSNYQNLIDDILKTYWIGRDNDFVSIYVQFLGAIATAHSGYIPLIIKMLIQIMASDLHLAESLPNETPIAPNLIYDRVHFSLKYILDLVPVSYTFLFSILAMEFPHKSDKTSHQVTYLKNLLGILEYAPIISAQVFGLIIDKIIQIDVEIQIELEDLDDEIDELSAIVTNESKSYKDELLSCQNNDIEGNEENQELLDMSENQVYFQTIACIKEIVNKLDSMLIVLFDYLSTIFSPSKEINCKSESLKDIVFDHLLRAFDSIILHTFRSRYTQFIFFWASQTNEKYTNMFLQLILDRTLDDSRSHVSRSISCAYVASFVARAAKLNKNMVRNAVNMLCRWINMFLDEWENDSSGIIVKKFNSFYFIVQSVLYIFCFRWRDLTEDNQEQGPGWLKSLFVLQRAIASKLNPLKYCSSNIVSQFAEIAHQLNFLYCYPMIEQGKQLSSSHSSQSTIHIDIQTYFPFDPYHLKLSRHFIDPIYIEWKPITEFLNDLAFVTDSED